MPRARRSSSPVRRPIPERRAPPPQPARQMAPAPAQQMAPHAPASQGPGLMGQMAATAGGVAIGSVVGHGVSQALFGGGGGSAPAQEQPVQQQQQQPQYMQQQQPQYMQQQQQQPQVCSWELQQFLSCAQNQSDISMCEGFNDALKQCKRNNGLMA